MRTKNKEKGGSAVEFALVLPILVVILFGIIEFGFVLYDKAVITNASREAARQGIVFHSPGSITWPVVTSEMVDTVNDYTASYLVSFGTVTAVPATTITGNCFTPGDALSVTVDYPYSFLVLPSFVTDLTEGITLSATTKMNCENR